MTEAPIAIITVTYSPGEYLAKFLDSVPANARVVMVDNGSTDGAPEAAADAGKAELLYSGGNIGYGAGMNLGARHLRAAREAGEINRDYLVISNPDVVFGDGAIDELMEAARRHPRAAALGPRIVEADGTAYPSARAVPQLGSGIGHALFGKIWPTNPWTKRYLDDADMDSERPAGWLSGSCLLLRWDAFEALGGFDERYFMYMEDVDLGDRLGRAGWLNVFVPSAEIRHAKGHVAGKLPDVVLKAHHDSAYRFQADRLPGLRYLPVRLVLKAGLKVREKIAIAAAHGVGSTAGR